MIRVISCQQHHYLRVLNSIVSKRFISQQHQQQGKASPDEDNDDDKTEAKVSKIEPVIGLEVHAQLNLKSKLFSRGSNWGQAPPNSQLDLLDIALPGSLPKLNGGAIRAAILTGLALNCEIQDVIHFDRKNYFYPDMPAGFQITQFNKPIAKGGHIEFIVNSYWRHNIAHTQPYDVVKYLYDEKASANHIMPYIKRSTIRQLQLEQDSAKTLQHLMNTTEGSLIDYNRSGAALLEIVFEPDLKSPHEASALVRDLITILRSIGTCDCELQEGSLRVDANVSIESIEGHSLEKENAGRVEFKNLNSLRSLNRGIEYEIQRQAAILEKGDKILQETRTFDSKLGETVPLREKESSVDYRYVPEPSIPPLRLDRGMIDELNQGLKQQVVLPSQIRKSLIDRYNLDLSLIVDIIERPGLADYMVEIMEGKPTYDPNTVADFLIYSITNLANINGIPIEVDLTTKDGEFMQKFTVNKVQSLFDMLFSDVISFSVAYDVMKCMFTSPSDYQPEDMVKDFNWQQITDEEEVTKLCQQLIYGMKSKSKAYRKKGEKRHLRFMLLKLQELHNNRVSVKKAIYCLNKLLRPQ